MNWKRMIRRTFRRTRTKTCILRRTGRAVLRSLAASDLTGDSLFPASMSWAEVLRERRKNRAYRRSARGREKWRDAFARDLNVANAPGDRVWLTKTPTRQAPLSQLIRSNAR